MLMILKRLFEKVVVSIVESSAHVKKLREDVNGLGHDVERLTCSMNAMARVIQSQEEILIDLCAAKEERRVATNVALPDIYRSRKDKVKPS